jgi:hypothetical protein
MSSASTHQLHTLYFDLSDFSSEHEFRLLCGIEGGVPLHRYEDHPDKLDEHRAANAALALISKSEAGRLTHFVEGVPLHRTGVSLRQVVFPSLDDHPLPELAMVFPHIGTDDVEQALRCLAAYRERAIHHPTLTEFGVEPEEALEDYRALHIAASDIKTPSATAQSIVLNHPEIGSTNPVVAKYVLDVYVNWQRQSFSELTQYIQNNGGGKPNQWYNKSWVMWSQNADGTGPLVPAEANTDLEYKHGKKITNWPTPPGSTKPGLPQYSLTDEYEPPAKTGTGTGVIGAATPVVSEVLRLTKDDDILNGLLWSRQAGRTRRASPEPSPSPVAPAAAGDAGHDATAAAVAAKATGFVLKDVTSAHGVWSDYPNDMSWNYDTKTLSFPVLNWYSRYLGAYVQFEQSDGTVIKRSDITAVNPNAPKPYTWQDEIPFEFLRGLMERSDTKNYLTYVSSGAAIFGGPAPYLTQKTNLTFLWPDAATKATVLLGGLGCASGFKDWDTDVDLIGVCATGFVNYYIGSLMLVAGVVIINPFITYLKTEWGMIGFSAVFGCLGAVGVIVGGALYDTSTGKFILSKLSNIAASMLFSNVVPRLIALGAQKVVSGLLAATGMTVGEITAEEAAEGVPIAGWALKVASIAADVAALTATTVECVLSPATWELDVLRTMDLTVTVTPDPGHGTTGFKPVWPLVSDHYTIQVAYPSANGDGGGTSYTKQGPMPAAHDDPIRVVFSGIPAGGKIDVTANVYSDTGWLAGRWESGWTNAVPDAHDQLTAGGAIKENPVPLTPSTSYTQKQTMVYGNGRHFWQVTAFSIASSLVAELAAGAPSKAVVSAFGAEGITLGANASVSVTTPGSSWSLSDPAAGVTYSLSLKQILDAPAFDLDPSYGSDLDGGGAPTSKITSAFAAHSAALPIGTSVTVVKRGSSWTIGFANQPALYVLTLANNTIAVQQTSYEIAVRNETHPNPPLPSVYPLPVGPTGSALGALQDIVHSNERYQLGYAWMASGLNLPLDKGTQPQNVPMYTMQSVSTLGQPQDLIIEPTRGFSQPMFIAYDQFGLTELFPLDGKFTADLVAGPVDSNLANEFAAFGHKLPAGSVVTIVTAGQEWTIGPANDTPLFQLRLETDGAGAKYVAVFAYPVPALDNFYLDPRFYTDANPVYYLRGVDLKRPPGEYSFDDDTTKAWGRFSNPGSLQALAVHPHGYVVGVDFKHNKLYSLKLPANAVASDQAPYAMPLSGEGVLQGLMSNPQALTITADGRILILEEGNRRIQAFDVKGNAVPCFSVGQPHFQIDGSFSAALDAHTASPALLQQFQTNTTPALAAKFSIASPGSIVTDLDARAVDAALLAQMVKFGYASSDDTTNDYSVLVTTPGKVWLVTDTKSQATFDMRVATDDSGGTHLDVFTAPSLSITVAATGLQWEIDDTANSTRYEVTKPTGSTTLTVQQLISYMPLRDARKSNVRYLDIAVEPKGYIYVLFVDQSSGSPVFSLDIYNPDGSALLGKPQTGVNAARLTVDEWRSLFTLNYNVVLGPNSRTEPGVSEWMPSTPDPATKAS